MTALVRFIRTLLPPVEGSKDLADAIASASASRERLARQIDASDAAEQYGLTGNIIEDHITGAAGKYQEGRRHGTR